MRPVLRIAVALGLTTVAFAAERSAQVESPDVLTLRRMVATVNAGDAAGYARLYSPGAVITIYGGEKIEGREAIERYEAALMHEFPATRLAFYSVWQAAPDTAVHYGVNGQTTTGQRMGHEGLLFFRFDQAGAIVEERRYLDSLTPMAQLGAFGKTVARPLPVLPAGLIVHRTSGAAVLKTNFAIASAALAAMELKDANTFFARTAAGTLSVDELMLAKPLYGQPNAAQWFAMWSAVRGLKIDITRMLGAGDDVVVETITHGTLSAPIGRVPAAERTFAVHRAIVLQVRSGAIARLASFINGKELAEQTGQWPLH